VAGELGQAGAGGSQDEGEAVGGEQAGEREEGRHVVQLVGAGEVEGDGGVFAEWVFELFHGGVLG